MFAPKCEPFSGGFGTEKSVPVEWSGGESTLPPHMCTVEHGRATKTGMIRVVAPILFLAGAVERLWAGHVREAAAQGMPWRQPDILVCLWEIMWRLAADLPQMLGIFAHGILAHTMCPPWWRTQSVAHCLGRLRPLFCRVGGRCWSTPQRRGMGYPRGNQPDLVTAYLKACGALREPYSSKCWAFTCAVVSLRGSCQGAQN